MDLRVEKWGVRLHIGISRSTKVKGVNSRLADGMHFLMWDFDDKPFLEVAKALRRVQIRHALPNIYILSTGLKGYWHAYCLYRHKWERARAIIADTDGVDKVFLAIACLRGYLTLRYSPKKGRPFFHAHTLESQVEEDVKPEDVESFVVYTTKRR